jgi:hypothetical protein
MVAIAFLSCSKEEDIDITSIEEPVNLQFNLEKIKVKPPINKINKSGYSGFVYDKKTWEKLEGVTIEFKEVGRYPSRNVKMYTVMSNEYGHFNIELKPGRYKMSAAKTGYDTYVTNQGFYIVRIGEMSRLNIFLTQEVNVPVAEKIEIVSGNNQSGTINTTLSDLVVVRVLDQLGNPFANHYVNIISHDGSYLTNSAITDANGLVSISWTLGDTVGEQGLSAFSYKAGSSTIPLIGSILNITATATP